MFLTSLKILRSSIHLIIGALVGGFLLLSLPQSASAQVVSFQVSPRYPGAYETTTVRLTTFATDMYQSQIYWYVNGEAKDFGVGKIEYQLETGAVGMPIDVEVVIVSPDGTRIDGKYTIIPIEVDMLWEANTYTPPFYKGKALPTYKSQLKVAAVPYGGTTTLPVYTYVWKAGRINIDDSASGYERQVYMTEAEFPQVPQTIGVALQTFGGATVYEGVLRITAIDPLLLVYTLDPLAGPNRAQAIAGEVATLDEVAVRVEPYYVSVDDIDALAVTYTWSVNGIDVYTSGQRARDHAFTKPDDTSGLSRIDVRVENSNRWQQTASKLFNVRY